jgi:tRNA-(ms[2]io[6]A)-hydroxylase
MALSFVAKYPDRKEIIPELIETAVEELEHFQQVYKVMEDRGVALSQEITKDEYMNQFLALCRSGKTERFMDRLLMASIVECRGCERFKLVAENLDDPELSAFYKELWRSEARHGNVFVSMALNYFDEESVFDRLDELAIQEAEIIQNLDIKAAVH